MRRAVIAKPQALRCLRSSACCSRPLPNVRAPQALQSPHLVLGQCPAYIGPRTDSAGFCRGYWHIDSCRLTRNSKPDNRSYNNSNVLCPVIGCSTHSHTLKGTSCQVRALCQRSFSNQTQACLRLYIHCKPLFPAGKQATMCILPCCSKRSSRRSGNSRETPCRIRQRQVVGCSDISSRRGGSYRHHSNKLWQQPISLQHQWQQHVPQPLWQQHVPQQQQLWQQQHAQPKVLLIHQPSQTLTRDVSRQQPMFDPDIEQAVTRVLERRMQNSSLASPGQPVVHQHNLIESTVSHEQHNSSQKQSVQPAMPANDACAGNCLL